MAQRRSLTLATGVILLAIIVGVVSFSQQQSESVKLNEEFNEFLQSHRGEVIVLDIMNTNCLMCLVEVQHLREFNRQYGDEVFLVSLSIEFGVWSKDTESTVEQFKRDNGVDWPLLIYEGGTDLIRRFNVYGLPTTVVFDQEGEVVFQPPAGLVGAEELASVVEAVLSGV